jgi:hypothetical protein
VALPALLRRWRALAAGDRRLVREALLWFLAIRVALRLFRFARVARWAEGRHKGRVSREDRARNAASGETPARIGWATAAVARRIAPPRSCLAQALTAQVMLGARGRAATIRFGAKREGAGPLDAHAWLECDGAVLVGDETRGDFVELRGREPAKP